MLTFPLLSDVYSAVLTATECGDSESQGQSQEDEARGLNPADARPAGPNPPDDDEDLETAPTRPLRLDRLRL